MICALHDLHIGDNHAHRPRRAGRVASAVSRRRFVIPRSLRHAAPLVRTARVASRREHPV